MQLMFKVAIAHLFEDVSITGLIDFEGFAAMGADKFFQSYLLF